MLLQILVGGLFDFSRSELRFKTLHVNGTIARHADDHQFAPRLVMLVILRMHHGDHHVLQNVGASHARPSERGWLALANSTI